MAYVAPTGSGLWVTLVKVKIKEKIKEIEHFLLRDLQLLYFKTYQVPEVKKSFEIPLKIRTSKRNPGSAKSGNLTFVRNPFNMA